MENIITALANKGWNVSKEPDKILHRTFPDYHCGGNVWEIFINGNSEGKEIAAAGWGKLNLPPFFFAVFWNGNLAGMFNAAGGSFSAHHEGANPETFVDSLNALDNARSRSAVPGPEGQ